MNYWTHENRHGVPRLMAWCGLLASPMLMLVAAVIITGSHHHDHAEQARVQLEASAKAEAARSDRIAQLVREVARDEFLEGVDPQDASLWSALVPYAELDRDCNALPECTQDTMHVARPITVTARSQYGDVAYIAVLGIEARTPGGGHNVIPRITYYVGNQGGALWRMPTGATQAEVRTPYLDEWQPVTQSASDWMRDEVRTAFIAEWRRRLIPPRAQAL
ncbi:MAG: hypothetical protein Q7R80_02145 [bacterium]|nr:hypothetical protein [bacterium]